MTDKYLEQFFDEIDNIVIDTMITDGPDGHCDGHEIITRKIIDYLKSKLANLDKP